MLNLLWVFLFVFGFNLIPVFSPPTWMVLSYLELLLHTPGWALALTGALAATSGRALLGFLANVIVRQHWLSEKTRNNIDVLKNGLMAHKKLSFSIFLFYAFSPLPSNQLFLAYGLTGLKIRYVALPFFLGRLVSYAFWVYTATALSSRINSLNFSKKTFFSGYFILSQILTLLVVYLFAKLDWQTLFKEKKFRLIKS